MWKPLIFLVGTAVTVTAMTANAIAEPSGSPVLWVDASDASTIFDDAGVNPGGIGFNASSIQEWRDKSSSGYVFEALGLSHASPAIANVTGSDTDPVWVDGVQNGLPVIRFEGAAALGDPVEGQATGLPLDAEPRRVFAAIIPRAGPVTGYFNYGNDSAQGNWHNMFVYDGGAGGYNYLAGKSEDAPAGNAGGISNGTPYIVEFAYDGASSAEWFTNGTTDAGTITVGGSPPLNTALDVVRLGRELGQTGDVDLLELVVYNESNQTANRNATGSYLASKWDITTTYVAGPPPSR